MVFPVRLARLSFCSGPEEKPPCYSFPTSRTGLSIPSRFSGIVWKILLFRRPNLSSVPIKPTSIPALGTIRNQTVLAVDLNAKHPVRNSHVSNKSGMRLLNLQDNSDFQISAPRCPTRYTPSDNGDVLDIVVHRNVRLHKVQVLKILDSDHVPILFHMLDHVSSRDILVPIETHRLGAVSKPSHRANFT
jgi:hypothetical protein